MDRWVRLATVSTNTTFTRPLPVFATQPFKRVIVEPDKEAVRTALEASEELSFAYLADREKHLKIRTAIVF
jgi:hypothetical protein